MDARLPYKFMDIKYKNLLPTRMKEVLLLRRIPDFSFPSFERKYGYKCTLSAVDSVLAISALLGHGTSWILQDGYARCNVNTAVRRYNPLGIGNHSMYGPSFGYFNHDHDRDDDEDDNDEYTYNPPPSSKIGERIPVYADMSPTLYPISTVRFSIANDALDM